MERPVLSICITTYNRPESLKVALDSIIVQINEFRLHEKVEIVVSDDAGSERTPSLIEPYLREGYRFVYVRNSPRLRFDLNYAQSIELAHGQYCWSLGDDDAIANRSLPFLVEYLKRHPITAMTVEARPFYNSEQLNAMLMEPVHVTEQHVQVVDSPEEAYERGYADGNTSSYIFLRDSWLESLDKKDFSKEWLYWEVFMKMLPRATVKKIAHVSYPLVYLGQECVWMKDGYELFIFLSWKTVWNKLESYGYDRRVYRREAHKLPHYLIVMLCRAKGHDLPYRWADYTLMVREFRAHPFYIVLASAIYVMPNFLFKWARDSRKFFARLTRFERAATEVEIMKILKKIRVFKFLLYVRHRMIMGRWWFVAFMSPLDKGKKYEIFREFITTYKLKDFVETGTYEGNTVEAFRNICDRVYSIELDHALWEKAHIKFLPYSNIEILEGDSSLVLQNLMNRLADNVLFWLDGHYSEGKTAKGALNTPIMMELQTILEKGFSRSVIIIDDARLFTGRNDYPTIGALEKFVKSMKPSLHFEVRDDLIRIFP